MPQVDLDTLASICSGGDRKIACEPLHAAGEQPLHDNEDGGKKKKPDLPDSPPESFWLSRDAEFDWFDRNAFYERKDSTGKGSNSANLNPNLTHPNTNNSSSQRFSRNLKAKAKIIGLPKTQKASYVDANRRNCKKKNKPANARFFNSGSGKSKALVEPSSPKVSCMGRVRSKRGRKKVSRGVEEKKKAAVEERSRTGMYGRFMAMFFRSRRRRTAAGQATPTTVAEEEEEFPARRSVEAVRSFRGEPPGLGGMTRFASGRRSASSWTGDE